MQRISRTKKEIKKWTDRKKLSIFGRLKPFVRKLYSRKLIKHAKFTETKHSTLAKTLRTTTPGTFA